MTGLWKAWKAKSRFPTFPPASRLQPQFVLSHTPAAFGRVGGRSAPPQTKNGQSPRIGLICSCHTKIHPLGRSAIQLQVKTILNRVQRFVGFVYREVRLHYQSDHKYADIIVPGMVRGLHIGCPA